MRGGDRGNSQLARGFDVKYGRPVTMRMHDVRLRVDQQLSYEATFFSVCTSPDLYGMNAQQIGRGIQHCVWSGAGALNKGDVHSVACCGLAGCERFDHALEPPERSRCQKMKNRVRTGSAQEDAPARCFSAMISCFPFGSRGSSSRAMISAGCM